MTEDEKNLVRDVMRLPGWELIKKMWERDIDGYRRHAVQAPDQLEDKMRTWFSGMAQGVENALAEVKEKVYN